MKLIDLPVELHQNISSFLNQPDLYALCLTCHGLLEICYPILWEAVSFVDQFPTFGIDPSSPASNNGPQLASPDICYACTISAPRRVTSKLIASKFRCYHSRHNSFKLFLESVENGTISRSTCALVKVISIFDVRGTEAMAKLIARLARSAPRMCLENVTNVQLFVANASPKPIDFMARFLRPFDKFYLIQDTVRNPMLLTRLIANKKPEFFYTLRWLDITVGPNDDIWFINSLLCKMVNLEFLYISNAQNPDFQITSQTFKSLTKLVRFKVSGEIVTTLKSFQASDLLPVTTSVKFDLSLQDDTTNAYLQHLEETMKHMNNQNFAYIESCSFLWSHVGSWNQVYNSQVSVKFEFPNVTKLELWFAKYEQERDLIRACPRLRHLMLKEISIGTLEFIHKIHPNLTSLSFSMVTQEGGSGTQDQSQYSYQYPHHGPPHSQYAHRLLSTPETATKYTKLLLSTIQKFRNLEFLAIGYQEVTGGSLAGQDYYNCLKECHHLAQVALMIPTKGFYGARSKLYKAYKDDPSGIMAFLTEGRYIYIGKLCYNALYLDVPNFKHHIALGI